MQCLPRMLARASINLISCVSLNPFGILSSPRAVFLTPNRIQVFSDVITESAPPMFVKPQSLYRDAGAGAKTRGTR